jgi:phosphoenolpyruvate-protein phosphotransferase
MAVDGETGEVVIQPSDEERQELAGRRASREAARLAARTLRGKPGATADGHQVALLANIGRPADAAAAIQAGAEGVGLFRTEFMFMGRAIPPGEAEQADAYASVLSAFGPDRPVVIRLADIGGDKGIPYLGLAPEENPFLGVRGWRLAYGETRSLLITQLRAIARAGGLAGIVPHVMAPMVATVEDVIDLRELVAEALRSLDDEAERRAERIKTGIMIEIPSAALIADRMAPHVDFMSIGSNDLTQYTLAADRTNARLGDLQDALHPAVLGLIRMTAEAGSQAGMPVAVCGELASDPVGALILVGLGVGELSMEAASLDAVRLALHGASLDKLRELAMRALHAETAAEVRELAS